MPELNPQNPKQIWHLPFHGAWPMAVAFWGSSRRVVAANRDGQFLQWDLPEPDQAAPVEDQQKKLGAAPMPTRKFEGHTNGVTRLRTTPDGKTLVSASLDHTIRLWNAETVPDSTAEVVVDLELRKDESRRTGKKEVLQAPGAKVDVVTKSDVLAGHEDWIDALATSADGKRVISGDEAARVIVWDLAERKEIARWSGHPWNWIVAASLSADGQTAVVSEYRYKRDDFDIPSPALKVWNVADGTEKLDVLKVQFPKFSAQETSYGAAQVWRKFVADGLIATDISPDGTLLATGQGGETETGKIHLIELETGKLKSTISGHQYGVTDVRFSSDGKYLLSAGRDTTVRICQVEDGKEVAQLGKPRGGQFKDWLSALAISPDEQFIAAADIAGWVHVWQVGA